MTYKKSNSSINDLLKRLTKEEKALLCSGKDFWNTTSIEREGIKSIKLNDGPHGVRATDSSNILVSDNRPSTSFPTESAMGATWNPQLIGDIAEALAAEAKAHGIMMLLGPGVNLKRSPLGGRNFEYFSEDPYLTGILANNYIKRLQSAGVRACLKHFICNEQETERMTINVIVDERTINEVYAKPFEMCINDSKPVAIMASYNSLNGESVSESKTYLKDYLRGKLGFEGLIVSDWGAVRNEIRSTEATLDLTMPGRAQIEPYINLSEEQLNIRAGRVLKMLIDKNYQDTNADIDWDQHYQVALKTAEESIVLLKNDKDILPLDSNINSIGIIGSLFESFRVQGSGSSKLLPQSICTPKDALMKQYPKIAIDYAKGYDCYKNETTDELIKEAIKCVQKNKINILFLGLTDTEETEGADRTRYNISECQQELFNRLIEIDQNIIVIQNCGTAVSFNGVEKVKSLLHTWLTGAAGGEALINIIFGKVNPSGKLSETFPKSEKDFPLGTRHKTSTNTYHYAESVLIGYRFYDYHDNKVLFPFGYGLSYTTFEYNNIKLSSNKINEDEKILVYVTIKNTGLLSGKETIQLYIGHKNSNIIKPVNSLRAFEKVFLEPGETKKITFKLSKDDFSYYNDKLSRKFIDEGIYTISVGSSSRDLPLIEKVEIKHSENTYKLLHKQLNENSLGKDFLVTPLSKEVFERTFRHLKNDNIYEIAMEMPLKLLSDLFPNLVTREEIISVLEEIHGLL